MKEFETYITRLQRMDYLIRTRSTGNPKVFADKIGVCHRSVDNYINNFRELIAKYDVSIIYSYMHRSYIYDRPGNFEIFMGWKDAEK